MIQKLTLVFDVKKNNEKKSTKEKVTSVFCYSVDV